MMKKIIGEIVNSIKNRKLNVFFLFVLSAFTILVFTKLSKEYTDTITFHIAQKNVPLDKVVVSGSNQNIQLTMKTHGFKWLTYYMSQPTLSIDFDNDVYVRNGKFVFAKSITYLNEKKQFKDQIKILDIKPDTIRFNFDQNLIKRVPVVPIVNIKYQQGFDVTGVYKTLPDSITIIGPENKVSKIDSLKTKPLELQNVKNNISQNVAISLPENSDDVKYSKQYVQVNIQVAKFTEGRLNIPVEVINLPQNVALKYFPKEIQVTYYTSLDNYSEITQKDFRIVCDYNALNGNNPYMVPELVKIPDFLKYAKLGQNHVEYIILK